MAAEIVIGIVSVEIEAKTGVVEKVGNAAREKEMGMLMRK
jgi:hypothetical protein